MSPMLRCCFFALVLCGCPAPPGEDSTAPAPFEHPLDDLLRVHHLQAKGTHNSYHQAPEHDAVEEWGYSHAPLDVQAACQGVRQFELDLHWQEDGTFGVLHVPALDPGTSCATLRDCLATLRSFSDDSPGHHPLFVMIEPKDSFREEEVEAYLGQLEAAVAETWPDRLLTPDMVRGGHADLAAALAADGWPTLGEVRGHLLLWLLDSGGFRDAYTRDRPSLEGRLLFVRSDPGDSFAAVMMRDDPVGGFEDIQRDVTAGYLVRTRADAGGVESEAVDGARRDTALASGATMISTDFPAPVPEHDYHLALPGGAPSRCNPLTAPAECWAEALEDPRAIDHRICRTAAD